MLELLLFQGVSEAPSVRRSCVQTAHVGTPPSTNRVVHNATTNNASSTMVPVREAREVSEGGLNKGPQSKGSQGLKVLIY